MPTRRTGWEERVVSSQREAIAASAADHQRARVVVTLARPVTRRDR